MPKRVFALGLALLLGACAGLAQNDQGVLQPQTVAGPCQVKKFFLLGFTAVHAEMAVGNNGQACSLILLNPDIQAVVTAALVTERASHGDATAGLVLAGRQAGISYTPALGYLGPDHFTVTLEPNDHAISFAVTVNPGPSPLP